MGREGRNYFTYQLSLIPVVRTVQATGESAVLPVSICARHRPFLRRTTDSERWVIPGLQAEGESMADIGDRKRRSEMMSGIRGRDTTPGNRCSSYCPPPGLSFSPLPQGPSGPPGSGVSPVSDRGIRAWLASGTDTVVANTPTPPRPGCSSGPENSERTLRETVVTRRL